LSLLSSPQPTNLPLDSLRHPGKDTGREDGKYMISLILQFHESIDSMIEVNSRLLLIGIREENGDGFVEIAIGLNQSSKVGGFIREAHLQELRHLRGELDLIVLLHMRRRGRDYGGGSRERRGGE